MNRLWSETGSFFSLGVNHRYEMFRMLSIACFAKSSFNDSNAICQKKSVPIGSSFSITCNNRRVSYQFIRMLFEKFTT